MVILSSTLENLMIPLGICVALPVLIVWLVMRNSRHETDQRTAILIEGIKNGKEIDEDLLPGTKKEPRQVGIKGRMLAMLLTGCLLTLVGIALVISLCAVHYSRKMLTLGICLCGLGIPFIVYFIVGTKMFKAEIEAEEKLRVDRILSQRSTVAKGIVNGACNDAEKAKGIAQQVRDDDAVKVSNDSEAEAE